MIELKYFSCFYSGKKIVDEVNLKINNGELTSLLGANGSGKSTLFKGICHRIETKGECFIDGNTNQLPPKRLSKILSYVPQKAGLDISCSVLDTVLMGAYSDTSVFSDYSKEQKEKAERILNSFISIDTEKDYLTLSAGQQQLVILARTCLQNANNLIFDEPDSALDYKNKHRVFKEIKKLSREKCVFISLHDPNFALNYCERLVFMDEGRIFADIYNDIKNKEELEKAFKKLYGDVKLIEFNGKLYLISE